MEQDDGASFLDRGVLDLLCCDPSSRRRTWRYMEGESFFRDSRGLSSLGDSVLLREGHVGEAQEMKILIAR